MSSFFSYVLRIETFDKQKQKGHKQLSKTRWRLLHLIIINSNFCLKCFYVFFS